MKHLCALTLSTRVAASGAKGAGQGKHLFILSGQSNMAGLNPQESFTPTVVKTFGKENVIVVKSAQGGQPIRRWYKEWKSAEGNTPGGCSILVPQFALYQSLCKPVPFGLGLL